MLKCAGPPNKECPHNAKLNECQIGFGDEMFCKPCMRQQREYRNNAHRESRHTSQGPPEPVNGSAHQMTSSCINGSQSGRKSLQETADGDNCDQVTGITSGSIGNSIV